MTAPTPLRKRSLKGELYARTPGIEDKLGGAAFGSRTAKLWRAAQSKMRLIRNMFPANALCIWFVPTVKTRRAFTLRTIYTALLRRVMEQLPGGR